MIKIIRLLAGLVIAGLFLFLIFRHISLREISTALSVANPIWALAAVIAFFLGYSFRIARWRTMLIRVNSNIRWRDCAGPLMASVAANNILPLRAGDVLRAFGFNRRLGLNAATALTSLFVERLLDLLMLVVCLGTALTYFSVRSSKLIGLSGGALLVCGGGIIFLLFFPSLFKPIIFWLGNLISRYYPKFGGKILSEFSKVFSALDYMTNTQVMLRLFVLSALAWISEGLVFLFAAISLHSISRPAAAWLAFPVGTISTLIPGTPGYVGTFDYFTSLSMITLGNPPVISAAYAFLVHAILWLPPTAVGGVYLMLHPVESNKIIKAECL